MQGTNVTIYHAPSDSSSGSYEVRFYEDGTVRCDCPASTFRGYTECKHVARLKANGAEYHNSSPEVYEVVYEGSSTALVGDRLDDYLPRVVKALGVGKEVTVKRLA